MIVIGEHEYKLSEPTMKEFRLILEFNHFKDSGGDVYREFSKIKQLLAVVYNNQFTASELDEAVVNGEISYHIQSDSTIKQLTGGDFDTYRKLGDYWVKLQDESKVGQVGLINYFNILLQIRLIEINYYRDLYQTISGVKEGEHTTYDESVKPSIQAIRNNLSLHYKNLIFTNPIYTLTELDKLTVTDFEYLVDMTKVSGIQEVRPKVAKHDEEFDKQLKELVESGGFGKGVSFKRVEE